MHRQLLRSRGALRSMSLKSQPPHYLHPCNEGSLTTLKEPGYETRITQAHTQVSSLHILYSLGVSNNWASTTLYQQCCQTLNEIHVQPNITSRITKTKWLVGCRVYDLIDIMWMIHAVGVASFFKVKSSGWVWIWIIITWDSCGISSKAPCT